VQAVKEVFVNIVDLVDSRRRRHSVPTFDTLEELAQYSKREHKIFPREQASAGNLLKYLLHEIL
jgi:hypothetical protein